MQEEYKIIADKYQEMSNLEIVPLSFKFMYKNPRLLLPFVIPWFIAYLLVIYLQIGKPPVNVLIADLIILLIVFLCAYWKQLETILVSIRIFSKFLRGDSCNVKNEIEWTKTRMLDFLVMNIVLNTILYLYSMLPIVTLILITLLIFRGYHAIALLVIGPLVYIPLFFILSYLCFLFFMKRYGFSSQIFALSNQVNWFDAIKRSTKIQKDGFWDLIIWIFLFHFIPILNIFLPLLVAIVFTHLYLKNLSETTYL